MEVALYLAAAAFPHSDISEDIPVPLLFIVSTVGTIIALVVLCIGCAEGCKLRKKRRQIVDEIPLMDLNVHVVPDGLAHSDHLNPQMVDQALISAIPKSEPLAIPYKENNSHQSRSDGPNDDYEPSGSGYQLLSRWYDTRTPTDNSVDSLLEGNSFHMECGPEMGRLFLPVRVFPEEEQQIRAEVRSRYLNSPHPVEPVQWKIGCEKCKPIKGKQRNSKSENRCCMQRYVKPSRLDKPGSLTPQCSDVQNGASNDPPLTTRRHLCRSLPGSATNHSVGGRNQFDKE